MAQNQARIVMQSGGIYAAQNEDGDFSVMSLEHGTLELGDLIAGVLDTGGYKDLMNKTKGGKVTVTLEDWECSKKTAIEHLKKMSKSDIFVADGFDYQV